MNPRRELFHVNREVRSFFRWWARIVPKARKFGVRSEDLARIILSGSARLIARRAIWKTLRDTDPNQLDLFDA